MLFSGASLVAVFSFLVVLTLSLVIIRVFTIALVLTGLSEEAARFQARSAYTGTGFTTAEAEQVVNHPVRRRIIMLIMLLRGAGVITGVASLLLAFVNLESAQQGFESVVVMAVGVAGLIALTHSQLINHLLTRAIEWALRRWTRIDARDYVNLLGLRDDYYIFEIDVGEGDWLASKAIRDIDLPDEGVLILGIHRSNGDYVGAPRGATTVYAGDTLVVYGDEERLTELSTRRSGASGDRSHHDSIEEHKRAIRKQDSRERRGGYASSTARDADVWRSSCT